MKTRDHLLIEVEAFLERTKMGPSHLCQKAGVSTEVVKRLRAGRDVQTETMDRLLLFMRSRPSGSAEAAASAPLSDAAA